MTVINGVWYDTEPITKNIPKATFFLPHIFDKLPNSEGIKIIKCTICGLSRMYILLMNSNCKNHKGELKLPE